MSRQTQNMVMGGLGFLVAVVTMVAATVYLTRPDDGGDTAAVQTMPGQAGTVDASSTDVELDGLAASQDGAVVAGANRTLDVVVAPNDALSGGAMSDGALTNGGVSTTTSTLVTTTAAPTTTTTTAPATTAAPTTTTVATSLAEDSTTVTAEQMSTTSETATTETTASSTTSSMATTSSSTSEATGSTTTLVDATTTTAAETTTTAAPTTSSTMAGSDQLNEVEREILRLTNALRTDPNGPLARKGAVINCNGRVRVDESNKYEPIGAVEGHLVASLQVARPWSAQMTINNFEHQPRAGVGALQAAGIQVRAAGENIAYTSYSDKAMRFFTGWRESDGHFCNMMDPNYTHLGVGEVTKRDQGFDVSFATQNFFSMR